MSFAMRGLTHCEECGTPLEMHEYCLCSHCQEKEDARKAEKAFQDAVARQVKLELAKRDNKIERLVLIDEITDNSTIYKGYWKDNAFHIVEK